MVLRADDEAWIGSTRWWDYLSSWPKSKETREHLNNTRPSQKGNKFGTPERFNADQFLPSLRARVVIIKRLLFPLPWNAESFQSELEQSHGPRGPYFLTQDFTYYLHCLYHDKLLIMKMPWILFWQVCAIFQGGFGRIMRHWVLGVVPLTFIGPWFLWLLPIVVEKTTFYPYRWLLYRGPLDPLVHWVHKIDCSVKSHCYERAVGT